MTPGLFGKMANVQWRMPKDAAEIAQQSAARLQHGFSLLIKQQLLKQEITVREFCSAAGKSYDRMLRVLNGQMVMKLEDVGIAEVLLGEVARMVSGEERAAVRQRLGLANWNL